MADSLCAGTLRPDGDMTTSNGGCVRTGGIVRKQMASQHSSSAVSGLSPRSTGDAPSRKQE